MPGYLKRIAPALLTRIDSWAGERIERLICAHHARRLRRIGRSAQLEPPSDGSLWAAGDPPVREGCELEVLVDGVEALPRIAEALEGARSHVHIAGWHVTPDFGLTRDADARPLRALLAELAERVDVRVLLWAGAPLPVFAPRRRDVRAVRDELTRGTRIRCALDSRERPMHCHHEKLVVIDGETAFVGGIDLTRLAGDRFDTSAHAVRGGLGWHDVATRLRGPAVADVDAHFRLRWREVTGDEAGVLEPPPAVSGGIAVQVVRTVPEKIYDALPHGDFRILESYIRALRAARSLVYLENQFLWSPEIVDVLARKLREPPSDEFRVVAVLPQHPNNGDDDTRGQVGRLIEADGSGERFLAVTTRQRSDSVIGPLYVHAKVGIVDDRWLTIGSANLNEHSLFNDSEMNVVACDERLARDTRLRLWSEHLELPVDEVDGPPAQVIDSLWRPIGHEERERRARGEPAQHRLLELPGVSRRSRALLGPLEGFVVDG